MSEPTNPPVEPGRLNGDGVSHSVQDVESEDDGYASDAASLEEVRSEEFPTYFEERAGRLFPSTPSPYPLPVDTPEQERLNLLHDLLLQFFGANYVGPVADVLRAVDNPDQPKRVLDLCTGTGKWVMKMAEEFPAVDFRGFDIVPITTRYPRPNVHFEIDDINARFRWRSGTFDLVNARAIAMAVRNYRQVLEEIARVLRPGGLFISYEWATQPAFHPRLQLDPAAHAPASSRFHDAVNSALTNRRGLQQIVVDLSSVLAETSGFTDIRPCQYHIPIGAWHEDPAMQSIGAACLRANERYAQSVRPFLVDSGWSEADVDTMLDNYIHEIRSVNGLVSVLFTAHARRL
ncbi:hypothetical protein CVT26_006726 [Gymnopilus dilepis]|uniref:Methyltransferase domain-containing protein n=1 Tax=Gymnopilus dilepis TaxID=231916 RepID=A0A409W0K1_9AGAR|nr:hypothetical protein CVT26_006726 [Gymnopilus dilepis]